MAVQALWCLDHGHTWIVGLVASPKQLDLWKPGEEQWPFGFFKYLEFSCEKVSTHLFKSGFDASGHKKLTTSDGKHDKCPTLLMTWMSAKCLQGNLNTWKATGGTRRVARGTISKDTHIYLWWGSTGVTILGRGGEKRNQGCNNSEIKKKNSLQILLLTSRPVSLSCIVTPQSMRI